MATRIAAISDLHLNTAEMRQVFATTAAAYIRAHRVDVLILAGDITPGVGLTISYVQELKDALGIPLYYVPGNHELWNRWNGLTTGEIYQLFLDDPNCLSGQVVRLADGTNLLGDIFWYDYSYADLERFTMEQFERKMLRGSRWQDAYYVDWGESDAVVSERFIEQARQQLAGLDARRTVFVSHMINHPRFSVPSRRFELWGFFNAYLGSEGLFAEIKRFKPLLAICGHVHHRGYFEEDGTTFACACLAYPKEWRYLAAGTKDLSEQIHLSFQLLLCK